MIKVGVIGSGAWGVAMANLCAGNGHQVRIWCHDQAIVASLQHGQHLLLPGVDISTDLQPSTSLPFVLESCDLIVFAIASLYVTSMLEQIRPLYQKTPILVLTKGFIDDESSFFIPDYLKKGLDTTQVAVLSGPNLAIEVAQRCLAATVIASTDEGVLSFLQTQLSNDYFRVYTSTDMVGVELGGILKNIMAIAAGCVDGLEMGTNAKSALMTRGLVEMCRFSEFFGGQRATLYGLSGLGDLITTCESDKSRNYRVGFALSQGQTLDDIKASLGAVAEGVETTRFVCQLSQKYHIKMPITHEIYQVLFHHQDPREVIHSLMSRPLTTEQ